jgi:hypothetical protein
MRTKTILVLYSILLSGLIGCTNSKQVTNSESQIMPYSENPSYWQYKGQPVLLLGATDNDNIFQNTNLESHLDSLVAIGGNYIRNTMSDRDEGDERAFFRNADGAYDMNKWNERFGTGSTIPAKDGYPIRTIPKTTSITHMPRQGWTPFIPTHPIVHSTSFFPFQD